MQILWFEVSALVLLILLLRLLQRLDAKQAAREQEAMPPGHGFDAKHLQVRLDKSRLDCTAAQLRPRKNPNHDLVSAAVRRSLKQLSYFRSARAREEEMVVRIAEESQPHCPPESLR